ncbi:MAG: class IV lanthionine synthetase LanL [Pseudonocardiaceae bacterium]
MTTSAARLQFTDAAPLEAQLAAALALHPYRIFGTRTWVSAHHSEFESVAQGWKLHVSARPSTLLVTLEHALPVLVARRCSFKVTRSTDVLREINSAGSSPGIVGKAVTVYPPQGEAQDVAEELADALTGFEGPSIRSDRKLRRGSPVYYRYGPIVARFRAQENGDFEPVLTAPDGTMTSGIAGPSYAVPDWVSNPFLTASTAAGPAAANSDAHPVSRLGGRYQVTSGISRAARGIICRARDTSTGRNVVIKQACAYIGEDNNGVDIRDHLRNERRILEALAGVSGISDFVDHFAHSDSEFLVVGDVGDLNLRQDVADSGTYSPSSLEERSLPRLAANILSLLDAVHGRGVVVRDLAPKNIVVSESGDLRLIDFEISRFEGVQCYGWTSGYSAPGQRADADATIEDDYFSLGATLAYAATGMEPICIDQDFTCNVAKTLHVLADVVHPRGDDMVDVIAGLLNSDRNRRREAAATIRRGCHGSVSNRYRIRRSGPLDAGALDTETLDEGVLDDAVRHNVRELVSAVRELIRCDDSYSRSTSAYLGSAGMGVELLYHRDQPGVPEVLAELAEWTAEREPALDRPRGLYFGSMGTAIFLVSVGRALRNDTFLEAGLELVDREIGGPRDEDRDDHIHGLAGLGTGYLILHHLTADQNYVIAAQHCAERIVAGQYQATNFDDFPDRRSAGIDVRSGFGHGCAGTAEFLFSCSIATGSTCLAIPAREQYTQVLKALTPLLVAARTTKARPMSISWCQGLAGIGTSLTRAAELGGERAYLEAAQLIGQASMAVAPRVPLVTQCCGLAGLGEFMLDVAAVSDEQKHIYHLHAHSIARYILTRSGGSSRQPAFPDHSLMASSGEWSTGSAGVLSFFRRLQGNGGSRLWSSGWLLP